MKKRNDNIEKIDGGSGEIKVDKTTKRRSWGERCEDDSEDENPFPVLDDTTKPLPKKRAAENSTKGGTTSTQSEDDRATASEQGFQIAQQAKEPVTPRRNTGSVPPPPAEVYHGRGRQLNVNSEDTSLVSEYKLRFEMNIAWNQAQIDVPLIFKHTIHELMKTDKDMCLLPVSPDDAETVIIKKSIHIPPNKVELQKHFQYNITPRKVEGLFRIRTSIKVPEMKRHTGIMNFLNTNKIWLKETAFNSARCALIG